MSKTIIKIYLLLQLILLLSYNTYSQMRGRVDESEYRDSEDSSDDSWTSNIITIAIIFGIPWAISELIKYNNKKKKENK